eukprot:9935480-Ditylum_brightwellii.AAC.1
MLVVLRTIVAVQNQGTQNTADDIEHLLDCCASHLDAVIRYCPSHMILRVHSNASYLSETKAQSRAGVYFYLGNQQPQQMNGPILVSSQILRNGMALAAEVVLRVLFENAKEAVSLHTTLNKLRHQHPATSNQVDNSTAHRIVNSNIRQCKSKTINVQFYWVKDRVKQGQFKICWELGTLIGRPSVPGRTSYKIFLDTSQA